MISKGFLPMNNKMDFVICYSNENSVQKCVQCISNLKKPDDFDIDIITIGEADNLAEAYNAVVEETDSKYRIYIQENVYITNPNFIFDCLREFEDEKVGMLGIIGGNFDSSIQKGEWNAGSVDICNSNRTQRIVFNSNSQIVDSVNCILMVTQYDFPWDNSQFLDIAGSRKFREAGLEIKIPEQKEPWAIYEYGASEYDRLDIYTNDLGAGCVDLGELPLVSVIIPVYNGAEFVGETIESVLAQTYSNLEVIVVDDNSKDNSRDIIDEFAQKDSRIKTIYNDKNENVCVSSNKGYAAATGKYIALVGHDDIWVNTKIEEQVKILESHSDISVCFSTCDIIDDMGSVVSDGKGKDYYALFGQRNRSTEDWIDILYYAGNCLCAPSAVIRKEHLGDNLYHTAYIQLQDYALWLDMLKKGRLYILQENLVLYRHFFGEKDNLSTMNVSKETRLCHENASLKYDYVKKMSKDDLVKLFGRHLILKQGLNEKSIECEKAFILKEIGNPMYFLEFSLLVNDNEMLEILESEYEYSVSDFYKQNTEPIMVDNSSVHTINELTDIIDKYEEIVSQLTAKN